MCNFGAGFSGTDTADEVSTKLFGVIGNILGNVSMAWRAGCNQKFVTLKFEDIFDNESTEVFSVGQDSKDRVKERKFITQPSNAFATYPVTNVSRAINSRVATRVVPNEYDYSDESFYQKLYDLHNSETYLGYSGFNKDSFADLVGTPLDKAYIWTSEEYRDAFLDFMKALFDWVEDANYGVVQDSSGAREMIASFLDLISGMDEMSVDVLKHILNEFVNHMTVDSFADLQQHFNYLM